MKRIIAVAFAAISAIPLPLSAGQKPRSVHPLFGQSKRIPIYASCEGIYVQPNVAPDFDVEVRDLRRRVVPDVPLILEQGPQQLKAKTDANGIGRFQNLAVGAYSIRVSTARPQALPITVVNDGARHTRMTWPDIPIRRVRRASGTLHYEGIDTFALSLIRAESGEVVLSTTAGNPSGRFAFPEVPPGLYFIHVKVSNIHGAWPLGDIATEIDPEALEEELDLVLHNSSAGCNGMGYSDAQPSSFLRSKAASGSPANTGGDADSFGSPKPIPDSVIRQEYELYSAWLTQQFGGKNEPRTIFPRWRTIPLRRLVPDDRELQQPKPCGVSKSAIQALWALGSGDYPIGTEAPNTIIIPNKGDLVGDSPPFSTQGSFLVVAFTRVAFSQNGTEAAFGFEFSSYQKIPNEPGLRVREGRSYVVHAIRHDDKWNMDVTDRCGWELD